MPSFRAFAITSAAVFCYCLAVSFGPALVLRGASPPASDQPIVQAHASSPLEN
jgi:hypothetical protein